MSRVIDEMNRHGKISTGVRWIGFALLAVLVLGGERIATSLRWKYPDWLRSLTGLLAIVIGILFIISALSVMRQAGKK